MRTPLILGLMIAATGCDRVFGLERDERCPYVKLEPDDDADVDGVLNGVDTCPLIFGHDPHDEDGDRIPDECDPCAMVAEAGADRDCDGIGAACDLDDEVPHVREFFGFGSILGLSLERDVAVVGDALRFTFPDTDSYGRAVVMTPVPADGTYEFHTTLALGETYCQHGFYLRDPGSVSYEVLFSRAQGSGDLRIYKQNVSTALVEKRVGAVPATFEMTFRLEIVGSTLTARVTGTAIETTEVTTTVAAFTGPIEYGVGAYCDFLSPAWRIEVPYLIRTTFAP